jgi:lipopolysaccharide transport system ATP-binding protein|tara:strand:- start:5812 stop:6522 length:711 start_codon:yes stop_codon:yes gene_type:complete
MALQHGQLLIRTTSISVSYTRRISTLRRKKFAALRDVSLEVTAGESLGIIGRNGVGKTTLLKVLASIIIPDSGTIENLGASTAMLAQQVGFVQEASGMTNILLSGLLLGYSHEQIRNHMDDIIEYSELGDFIAQPVKTYSAGMRARLGFSICYHLHSDVLMIDETLGAGDFEFRQKSSQSMREKIKSEQTVVLVSHDTGVIQNLCDRAIWLEDGTTKIQGDAKSVVAAYHDHYRKK